MKTAASQNSMAERATPGKNSMAERATQSNKSMAKPQIKVTLTKRLSDQIQARADELGTTKANYLRLLAIEDLKSKKNIAACKQDVNDAEEITRSVEIVRVDSEMKRRDKRLDGSGSGKTVRLDDLLKML